MDSGISFKGKNLSMSFTKLKYKWIPPIDTDKNILKLIILQKNIINKRAFLTEEPNNNQLLTTYKYPPILLGSLSKDSNKANQFIKQINKNISEGDNKNVWIYLNNLVIQFPILKIKMLNDDTIIIKCEIINKELCNILPKNLYNGTFINQKNNQYGWLTIDAVSDATTEEEVTYYGFERYNIYPYNQNLRAADNTLPTTPPAAVPPPGTGGYPDYVYPSGEGFFIKGLSTPLCCNIISLPSYPSTNPYTLYIKALICVGTFNNGEYALFQCFGNDNNDLNYSGYSDPQGIWGYSSGQCLNLFLYINVEEFNQTKTITEVDGTDRLDTVTSIYNYFRSDYYLNNPNPYGFYQAIIGPNQNIGATSKASYSYNVTPPTVPDFGGNALDKNSAESKTPFNGTLAPITNVVSSAVDTSYTPASVTVDLSVIPQKKTNTWTPLGVTPFSLVKLEAQLSYIIPITFASPDGNQATPIDLYN